MPCVAFIICLKSVPSAILRTAVDAVANRMHNSAQIINLPILRSEVRLFLRQTSCRLSKTAWFDQQSKNLELYLIDLCINSSTPSNLRENRKLETFVHRLRLGTAVTRHFYTG